MNSIGSTLATVWRIAIPYFRSEDKWAGRILLAAVILIELATVAFSVVLNQWRARFFNALQEYNWDSFVYELGYFTVVVTILVVIAVYQTYLNQWLQIRWRKWMTEHYLSDWLTDANHYRMQLQGDAADNPDQRIADDIKMFVDYTLTISLGMLNSVVTLLSFVIILWGAVGRRPPCMCSDAMCRFPGLSGLGRADLFDPGNMADARHRLAAGRIELPPAAIRSGLPFQPDARTGKFRTDRAAEGRSGGRLTAARPLQRSGRELARHHEPDQNGHGLHAELQSGRRDFSLHSGGAGPTLLTRCNWAG